MSKYILPKDVTHFSDKEKYEVLKRFMKEHFHFCSLRKAGLFTKEMRGDYKAQAERICRFFGLKSIYEYGTKEIRCHITEAGTKNYIPDSNERKEPFTTVVKSWLND